MTKDDALLMALEALESIKVVVSTRTTVNVIDGIDLFPDTISAIYKALGNDVLVGGSMKLESSSAGYGKSPSEKLKVTK